MAEEFNLYQDIAGRTGGSIYIGCVGPVRTGKSTFIKNFMELMILPGGMPGTLNLEKSPIVTTCAEYCAKNDIYLAAICAAPSVLGHLGLLNGKEAICFPGFEGELKGATISEKPVCVDGKIVTAKGMGVAVQFGLTLAGLLTDKDVEKKIHDGIQCTD